MINENYYSEFKSCIDFIRNELKSVNRRCENAWTISRSNQIFFEGLELAKVKAFKQINSMNKPYLVYAVNKYYSF